MNPIGQQIFRKDTILNNDNFLRIEKLIQETGQDIIWSNLYGHGLFYLAENVQVIYSCLHFISGIPKEMFQYPTSDFLQSRFFFIDIFPETLEFTKEQKIMYARCDSEYTLEVKSLEDKLQIQDLTEWYKQKKVGQEVILEQTRHAFETLLL